jgi:hypothetical protein
MFRQAIGEAEPEEELTGKMRLNQRGYTMPPEREFEW